MAYVIVVGACISCGQTFNYNPHLVPSSRAITGEREPICAGCVERINPIRIAHGLRPIVPLPGAYDVSDESEL